MHAAIELLDSDSGSSEGKARQDISRSDDDDGYSRSQAYINISISLNGGSRWLGLQ